ncbi:MAG: phosphotyrosine protein phosphatase [Lewinella sp.]
MKKILFVCSANIQRSKTAEDYFAEQYPTLEFASAGTNLRLCRKEGTTPLTEELMEWADTVLVMEERHRKAIGQNGGARFGKKIRVLGVPDRYKYFQRELIELLEERGVGYFG